MILLNLVLLSPIATSMVEDAVEDNFETYPYDTACADSDCTTAEEDWASSTSDRSYYAWNLTNADEVMAGGEAVYEKLGPFDYEITTTRNIIAFDKDAGTLTYDESKVFTFYTWGKHKHDPIECDLVFDATLFSTKISVNI